MPVVFLSIVVIAALVSGLLLLRQELIQTRDMWMATQGQLVQTEVDLQTVQFNLSGTEAELASTETNLAATEIALEAAGEQTVSVEIALENLEVNYDRLLRGHDYASSDPTYDMVMDFLADDRTNSKHYDATDYNCTDYSADVKANAADEGIRCAYVTIRFVEEKGHSIVAFDTTDEGLIFIEPQTDDEVDLREGRRYHESVIAKPGQEYLAPDDDDTVVRFTVIW